MLDRAGRRSITLTVPPISDDTQTSAPSAVKVATRGRWSTRILSVICLVSTSMKCFVGGLRGVDHDLAVRADAHAFRLDHRDLGVHRTADHIDHRDQVVVLVGGVDLAVGRDHDHLGIRSRRQLADDLQGLGVQDLDRVVSLAQTYRNCRQGQGHDAARAFADLDLLGKLELVTVDDADRITLLVRDVDRARLRPPRPAP